MGKTKSTDEAKLTATLVTAIKDSALPGEDIGFDDAACERAAKFALSAMQARNGDAPHIDLESFLPARDAPRLLRLAIVNDDMPFLVDSVCNTIAAHGLNIERLIHPVVSVTRGKDGKLNELSVDEGAHEAHESVIYIELERVDAKQRRQLKAELEANLADVAAAVGDWLKMQVALEEDADRITDGEGSALLRWFLDRNFTLLGHEFVEPDGTQSKELGLSRLRKQPLLSELSLARAFKWFAEGGQSPLIIKSNIMSTVHRRVLMDLIITPVREGEKIVSLSMIAGLWTSAALAAPPHKIPLLRTHLSMLFDKFGFSVSGHAGKSLTHAMTSLPHDLLIAFSQADLERLALISMSLIDRPRPKLHTVRSPLARHLFAFVWLPRDQMSTERRENIEKLLTDATEAKILSFSNSLDEGGITLLRYTIDLGPNGKIPDPDKLDRTLEAMVRGWRPAVENALAELGEGSRSAVLATRYADCFPSVYRNVYGSEEAARDILRLVHLDSGGKRSARLYRLDSDAPDRLRLKIYHLGGAMPLSDAVPTLENFGFTVLEEIPTPLDDGELGYIHDFLLAVRNPETVDSLLARAIDIQRAIAAVLEGWAENDLFNRLVTEAALSQQATVWFRSWFRYLRQTGLTYGMLTVVEALAEAPEFSHALSRWFQLRHDPDYEGDRDADEAKVRAEMRTALAAVDGIDDDHILRLFSSVVGAILRTNAFAPQAREALAYKIESSQIAELPQPVPWREIFVYSPRVEGIHLRTGSVARGGLRWSDRRDDFRTEILGLMKAQRVKNAVIVPTGAKGGFFAKMLPPPDDRDAFIAEGTEAYRIFIRSLLSVTDNIFDGKVVHPEAVNIRDGEDPYFVVAADKGTATFSDIANAIALERGFWLGDAFASGGKNGYDHKAMGITARGAWVSVQRHFAEMGVDVQADPVSVVGVGDMSGDVFGNGMLLSKSIKLVAAFDHRHIFIDPNPDPATSWKERKRLFDMPRSSWEDYDGKLISKGGGVYSRASKSIQLSAAAAKLLDLEDRDVSPQRLMNAILKAQADLLWFGGIGTYVKSSGENHIEVGDPTNDAIRINADQLRVKAIGEGANLGITQAARIEFALDGGRLNTDFVDNSAGVDCSDNEVNIKIALDTVVKGGELTLDARNDFLESMTDAVADIVLEDNRLQALGLSIAEIGGRKTLPSFIRMIEQFEENGEINRAVEGLGDNEELSRRLQDKKGLVRPELAVLVSTAKLALQAAIEASETSLDPFLDAELLRAFPEKMREKYRDAIIGHQLRRELIATKLANRMVNRLGLIHPFELAEEEGCGLAEVARAFIVVEQLIDAPHIWHALDTAEIDEPIRLLLFDRLAYIIRSQMADLMRSGVTDQPLGETLDLLKPHFEILFSKVDELLTAEGQLQAAKQTRMLVESGATEDLAHMVARIYKIDGAPGIAHLAADREFEADHVAAAFTDIGSRLGLDWAQMTALRITPSDPWDRLLVSGLARDFQQMRLDFLRRARGKDLNAFVDNWAERNMDRVAQFRKIIDRAQRSARPSISMLAQIAGQARILLSR